jgi:hypothetical protein
MRRFVHKPSPAMLVAAVALLFAMAGTGLAASRYIITSTSQIKPSVLRVLQAENTALAASAGSAKRGVNGLRLRAHLSSGKEAVVSRGRMVRDRDGQLVKPDVESVLTLTESEWTQYPEELNELIGTVTLSDPTEAECGQKGVDFGVEVLLDGEPIGRQSEILSKSSRETVPLLMEWEQNDAEGTEWWLFPGTSTMKHTLEVVSDEAEGTCKAPYAIDGLTIDVLGVR